MEFFVIEHPIILEVSGRDSQRYLNNRLTNNIKNLTPGTGCRGAALNPQGRTQAFFQVIMREAESYLLSCDGGSAEEVTAAFKKYIVADRITVTHREDLVILHAMSVETNKIAEALKITPLPTTDSSFSTSGDITIIRRCRGPVTGFDIVAPRSKLDTIKVSLQSAGGIAISDQQRLIYRIKAHRPEFPGEMSEKSLFSEAGLEDAVSFTKGCYVGQEVVEKIDARDSLPKILRGITFSASSGVAPGATITRKGSEGEENIGKILFVAADQDGSAFGFASVKNEEGLENASLFIADVPCRLLSQA